MAQITEVRLIDDLDGGEAAESVAFSIDGKFYEIDLSEKNATTLRDTFAPFVGSARRAGGGRVVVRQKASARSGRPHAATAAIREWANANGHEVSARGRIPSAVLDAYQNRGNTPAAKPAAEAPAEAEVTPKRRTRRKAAVAG